MTGTDYDVIIIGGGPGGVAAGIYCRRAMMRTLVIEKGPIGGMLLKTDVIENYPGFQKLHGYELATEFENHLKGYEAEIIHTAVHGLHVADDEYRTKTVRTEKGDFTAPAVIVASGGTPRPLDLPNYEEMLGRGVSTCAICDAPFYKGKKAAVVGGGDAAIDESVYLSRFVTKLYVIHRRDKLKAEMILQKKLLAKENVEVLWDSVITEIKGGDVVKSAVVKNVKTEETREIEVDGVFNYTGHKPNTSYFETPVDVNDGGYIVTDQDMQSSIPGLFAAGDVRAGTYRQAVIAAGEGAMSALGAHHYVTNVLGIELG